MGSKSGSGSGAFLGVDGMAFFGVEVFRGFFSGVALDLIRVRDAVRPEVEALRPRPRPRPPRVETLEPVPETIVQSGGDV